MPNCDLWQPMVKLRARDQEIFWVRGHNNDFYNERADALALQGRLANTPKETA
ncbi:ribonuclease H [compost metagenome]